MPQDMFDLTRKAVVATGANNGRSGTSFSVALLAVLFCSLVVRAELAFSLNEGAKPTSSRYAEPVWEQEPSAPESAPNVLVIILDDTGFADFGAFGSEINTPGIDRLSAEGLRYNNFTTTAVCSPSRAALLTGLNHHSAGVGWLANMNSGFPGYRGEIRSDVMTLPEVLRENGYNTFMVGKWHLTNSAHLSAAGPFDSWPMQRGFEQFWGILDGESNQWNPAYVYEGNRVIDVPQDGSFYFPDAITEQAIDMLRAQRAASRSKPFFLYYATTATHAPHHTLPRDREKYRGRYDEGYDVIRSKRLAKQKALGIVPENTELTPHYPKVKPWSELADDERLVSARLQENYAAYLDNTDQQIGKLIAYLEESGELDNTIIVVTSDNGASKETGTVGTTMATRYFNGIADTTEKNMRDIDKIGGPETHPNYPHGWLQVSNTPFKLAKATTHGGGVRDPLIIHWPQGIEEGGEIRPQFHHINDITPTILEAIGIDMPASFRGESLRPIEGTSMAYTFNESPHKSRKTEQYYELEANRAYVADGWKIVTRIKPGQPYDSVDWELYNLNEDFSENNNLAAQFPEKVKVLEKKWWEAAERYNVLPIHDEPIIKRAFRSLARMGSVNYKRYDYNPGADTIHNIHAPLLYGRNFTLVANADRDSTEQEGVLAAMGGYDVGYTFFIKDNHLYYGANIGGEYTQVRSSQPLPKGRIELQAKFSRDENDKQSEKNGEASSDGSFSHRGLRTGKMTLLVDGKVIGSAPFLRPVPKSTWEGLDIGRDQRTAVSKEYRAPFPFQGTLESVHYRIDR
ncbi:MAG: arylsulfatase A-like enzyme [Halieaceae bacterium]